MKKIYSLFVFVLLLNLSAKAQSKFYADAMANVGFESNVFNSPESYLDRAGTLYNKKDLVVSGAFAQYGWNMKYKTTLNKKHKISIQNKGGFKTFFGVANANQGGSDLKGKYIYQKSKKLSFGYNLALQRSKKLVTNILGDEVTAPFTFSQFINEGYVQYAINNNNETRLGGYYKVRKYKSDPTVPESLSYNTPALVFSTEQTIDINNTKTILKLGVESKGRKYTERTARDSIGNSVIGVYPKRDWSYFITNLTYSLRFNNGIRVDPFVEYTKRTDNFQDQFSYKEIKSGLKLAYNINEYSVKFKATRYNKNYNIRPALLSDGTEIPLSYKYFKFSLNGEYSLSKKFTVFLSAKYESRDSNVTNIGRRPRREYKTYEVYGGVMYSFQKNLKSK